MRLRTCIVATAVSAALLGTIASPASAATTLRVRPVDTPGRVARAAVGRIQNDGVQVVPTISIGDVTAFERKRKTTEFVFMVTLSAASTSTVRVSWATADGTALAGSDYLPASGILKFSPGLTVNAITVKVKGDRTKEPDETFFVNLSAPKRATIADGQGLGTILNDD